MKKFILLIPVVFMFILSQVGLANAVTVRLDPSTVNLTTTGATFGINVRVDDVTNLGGFQFDIGYTPAIVTVENTSDVTLGSFLGSTGRTVTAVGPSIDNTAGKVTFGAFSFGAAAGPDGSGLLATIKFTVQSQTAGTLDLNNVILTDTSANPITVDVIGDTTLTVTTAPAVTLNPTSLAFGDQDVGTTTSTAQTVTLTNSGNATLNITSITASGNFAATNTCGATLAAGANCTISVTFSPTATGNRTGQITVTTDAASSPDTVALSGTGTTATVPAVTLDPTSLAFGDQDVGTTSTAQTVTLTNSGNATLNITSITASGNFAATNTCGATLAAGANCTISVTFSPTATGNRTGQITVSTDAASSPDTVALSGTGTGEVAAIPTSVPTMNEWGMIILIGLFSIAAIYMLKRKEVRP